MLVAENGKLYNIDEETGLVTEASVEDAAGKDVLDSDDLAAEFRIGDRVEVAGKLGETISLTASVYGPAWGVRFDDGSVGEFAEMQMKKSEVEKPDFESPVQEVFERFEAYTKMPAITNEEIDTKEQEARWLNLRAKSLVTDSKLAFSDQNDLGHVVLVTGTDLMSIKELRERSQESEEYLERFNRYKVASDISGYGATLGVKRSDTSWLHDALDGMEVVETTDADLAARATEVVARLTREQLEDDESMRLAASFQHDYLQLGEEQAKKFASYLERARQEKLAEPVEKNASTDEDDLGDFDTSALYM